MATYHLHSQNNSVLCDLHDIDFDSQGNITIDRRENICCVCARPYVHRKRYLWANDKTIKEVELVTDHPGCRSITRQIKEYQQKILDLEYKLFILKTS